MRTNELAHPPASAVPSPSADVRAELVRVGSVGALSVLAHLAAALGLGLLPSPAELVPDVLPIELTLQDVVRAPAPPEPVPEEPEAVEPEIVEPPTPVAAAPRREPIEPPPEELAPPPPPAVEPEPPPAAAAAPSGIPSLDDAYGEPSGGPAVLGAPGGGAGFASGPGGHGVGTGTGTGGGRRVVVPSGPSTIEIARARRRYVRELEVLLRERVRYPTVARRAGHQGRVELALRVGNDGRLLGVRVATSSGFDDLDDAAVEAARRLSPPPPPAIVRWAAAEEVRAPVVYVLQ